MKCLFLFLGTPFELAVAAMTRRGRTAGTAGLLLAAALIVGAAQSKGVPTAMSLFFPSACPDTKDCGTCVGKKGCGFCGDTKMCVESNADHTLATRGSCLDWQTDTCRDQPCSIYKGCTGCLSDALCGWCSITQQCLEDTGAGRGPIGPTCGGNGNTGWCRYETACYGFEWDATLRLPVVYVIVLLPSRSNTMCRR